MVNIAQRQELADFLRARRGQLSPREVGIEPGPRRRTPGLRREEVAQLSGVSVTWYTWLEQARDITVSGQVLDSLARALQLNPAEKLYMYTLADKQGVVRQETADAPNAQLQRLVDALNPNPTYLIGPSWDLLAWNAAEAGLIGDPARLAGHERNIIRMVFTDPETRRLLADWRAQASGLLAQFRADAVRNLGDPRFEQLSSELYAVSAEFRELWDEHRVADFGSARWEFDHPRLGRLAVDYVRLAALQFPGVKLFTCLPADAETEAKLPALADPDHRFGSVGAEAVAGVF
ncbi:helix-turn-helix transcriptional regulator [Streptomyces sp. NBC_00322]|uniref:helix-turn-helix transcriptional regulator n=1 Tax=Streptomyces sp. NBC_00322 TaxID=2975712 RepID=UPI002E2D3767|nr:helix-turn-helix transcriptional regulator [Streptomyces sp. NBC_00322]